MPADWTKLKMIQAELEALMAHGELTMERELELLEEAERAADGDPELVAFLRNCRAFLSSRPPPGGGPS